MIFKTDEEIDDLFPVLDNEIYAGLMKDIKKRGIQEQLTIAEDGTLICGYNRYKIAQELKIPDEEIPYKTKKFSCRMEMIEYAVRDNVLRRQLNLYQKCLVIKAFMPYAQKLADYNAQQGRVKGASKGGKASSRKGIPNSSLYQEFLIKLTSKHLHNRRLKNMEELSEYEKKLADQYEGKKTFDIGCHMAFNVMKTQEKEEKQSVPSYDSYKKFEKIEDHGTEIQKMWGRTGFKSIYSLYNNVKKQLDIKIPEDKVAIKPTDDYNVIFFDKKETLPEEGEVIDDVEIILPDGRELQDANVVFYPKELEVPENGHKLPKGCEVVILKEKVEVSDKFTLKNVSWLKKTSVWTFAQFDNRFGGTERSMEYPSRIPGQILMNLMYGFTESGDLIIDPFAGSGTSHEVVTQATIHEDMKTIRDRKILCYDINPYEEYIRQNDMTQGFPKNIKEHFNEEYPDDKYNGIKMIFFDIPYWSMKAYANKKGFDGGSLDDFYVNVKKLATDSFEILKLGGIIAFIIIDQTEKDTGRPIHHGINSYNIFKSAGFKPLWVFDVPVMGMKPVAASPAYMASKSTWNGTVRLLFVMEK